MKKQPENNGLKIGDKVTHFDIKIDALMNVDKVVKTTHKVIGISDTFIQLDGQLFPKLANDKSWHGSYDMLENVRISEKLTTFDIKHFGKFRVSMFSAEDDRRIETCINKEFNSWLVVKIGTYGKASKINIKLCSAP